MDTREGSSHVGGSVPTGEANEPTGTDQPIDAFGAAIFTVGLNEHELASVLNALNFALDTDSLLDDDSMRVYEFVDRLKELSVMHQDLLNQRGLTHE